MWNRHAEADCYGAAAEMVRNSAPMFEGRGLPGMPEGVPQIPALAERGRQTLDRFLHYLDDHLASNTFVAGETFSIADITVFVTIGFSQRADYTPPAGCNNLARWQDTIAARPSATP